MNEDAIVLEKNESKEEEPVQKKKPGRKPKNLQITEETKVQEIIDYDYVIKVLDSAKKKVERQKNKEKPATTKEKKAYSDLWAFAIPTGIILILVGKFIMLFVS